MSVWNVNNLYSVSSQYVIFVFHLFSSFQQSISKTFANGVNFGIFFFFFYSIRIHFECDTIDNALNSVFGFDCINDRIFHRSDRTEKKPKTILLLHFVFSTDFVVHSILETVSPLNFKENGINSVWMNKIVQRTILISLILLPVRGSGYEQRHCSIRSVHLRTWQRFREWNSVIITRWVVRFIHMKKLWFIGCGNGNGNGNCNSQMRCEKKRKESNWREHIFMPVLSIYFPSVFFFSTFFSPHDNLLRIQ